MTVRLAPSQGRNLCNAGAATGSVEVFVSYFVAAARSRMLRWRSLPGRRLLIVSPQRSGSTLLLDVLRGLPGIALARSAVLWERLGLLGRRYPRDLSGALTNTPRRFIEIRPGRLALVPTYETATPANAMHGPRWWIEKLHPHFFGGDAAAFNRRLHGLGPGETLLLLHVRQPDTVLQSHLDYQARRQDWYPDMDQRGWLPHILSAFEALVELRSAWPTTLVTTFDELVQERGALLDRVAAHLEVPVIHQDFDPTPRMPPSSDFLGSTALGDSSGRAGGRVVAELAEHPEMLRSWELYRELVETKSRRH